MAWFSLRVREVPGWTPRRAPCLLYCQKNFTSRNSIHFYGFFFIAGLLHLKNWANERKKESEESKRKRYFIRTQKLVLALNCETLPLICFITIHKAFFERFFDKYLLPWKCLFLNQEGNISRAKKAKWETQIWLALVWVQSLSKQKREFLNCF